jgi:hypothetical protein
MTKGKARTAPSLPKQQAQRQSAMKPHIDAFDDIVAIASCMLPSLTASGRHHVRREKSCSAPPKRIGSMIRRDFLRVSVTAAVA